MNSRRRVNSDLGRMFVRNVIAKLLVVAVLVLSPAIMFGQKTSSDRCEVGVAETKQKNSSVLGSFTTTIAEEQLTTKAFRLPGTKLFIVASVFYTDESMGSEKGNDSMQLELLLSKTAKRDALSSLSWSEAELPLNDFTVGRVTMMVRTHGRLRLVIMECRKHVRI